jgi:YgiT-type zinc finger domain-containing protein
MICLICRQAEIMDGRTSVKFERGEIRLIVNYVPARICPHCGEAYIDEEVTRRLLQGAGNASESGVLDTYCDYSDL